MKPRNLEEEGRQEKIFQARLDQILNLKHALVQLGQSIDWAIFEREMGALYVEKVGCPGLPIRLLVRSSWKFGVGPSQVIEIITDQ